MRCRSWRHHLPTFGSGIAATIGVGVVSALACLPLGEAVAQAPGQYVQQNLAIRDLGEHGTWTIQVESVDVFKDRSLRVNLIITNASSVLDFLTLRDPSRIHLVSDALERVSAEGKPEGQWAADSAGNIQFVANDAVRLSLKFPSFHHRTKTVTLIFYKGGVDQLEGTRIPNIKLSTKP
jgi:hypothetical protein